MTPLALATAIALLVGSYLLGSVSWSVVLVRRLHGVDVRQVGSGNAGATNVLRISGTGVALAVLVLDMAKGASSVAAARLLQAPGPVVGCTALAAVLGHLFPIYHGFRGGKGMATAAGALILLAPLPAALAILVFLIVTLTTRWVSLGSMTSVVLFAPLAYVCGAGGWSDRAPAWLLSSSAAIAGMIVLKHHDNIRRLRRGTEHKLGERRGEEAT